MASLISLVAGGALTLAGGIGARMYQHWKERKQLESALAADMHTFDNELERIYALTFLLLYPDSELSDEVPWQMKMWYEKSSKEALHNALLDQELKNISETVYASNMDKIGQLNGNLPQEIIKFYNNHSDLKYILESSDIQDRDIDEIDIRTDADYQSEIAYLHTSVCGHMKKRYRLLRRLDEDTEEDDRFDHEEEPLKEKTTSAAFVDWL